MVLNASYEPLCLIPWQRAITLWCEGKIEIIDEYPDKEVRSVTIALKMPSVVRFLKYVVGRKKAIRFSRENIYLRDNGKCQYCSRQVPRDEYTYDHVVPKSQGGTTTWDNIVTCCIPCNQKKGGRTPDRAGMKLLSKPCKPEKLPDIVQVTLRFRKGMPESWKQWIRDVAYWRGSLKEE